MQDHGPSVTDTSRRLPLFALPEFALLPHTLVPFHVFEPRYCDMLDVCLADRRLLVVAGLQPGWEDHELDPPVHEIAGLGRILSDRRFHDGRFNIFVHCIARVRIRGTVGVSPHLVDVEHLEDLPGGEREDVLAAHLRLAGLTHSLVRALGPEGSAISRILGSTEDPAVLSNRLAAALVHEPSARQRLLEMRSPLDRCQLLADVVAEELMACTTERPEAGEYVN